MYSVWFVFAHVVLVYSVWGVLAHVYLLGQDVLGHMGGQRWKGKSRLMWENLNVRKIFEYNICMWTHKIELAGFQICLLESHRAYSAFITTLYLNGSINIYLPVWLYE